MPRIAIEAVVAAPFGDVRVDHDAPRVLLGVQRMAQVDALRALYADGHAHARDAPITKDDGSRSRRSCARARRSSPATSTSSRTARSIRGCWRRSTRHAAAARRVAARASGEPHPSTFCIYQKTDPAAPSSTATSSSSTTTCAARASLVVDQQTQASDHQPVILTLAYARPGAARSGTGRRPRRLQ
jgi:hypothetical protein